MFTLHYKIDDTYKIEGKIVTFDMSFGNVLRFLDLSNDKTLNPRDKALITLAMITKDKVIFDNPESYAEVSKEFRRRVMSVTNKEEVKRDIKGNVMPEVKSESDDNQQLYDLTHDAKYIYASFVQAYNINLLEVQDKLHWYEFNALLTGLPDNTKFSQVLSIRGWKKSKGDSQERVNEMRRLQKVYRLPDREEESHE